MAEFGKSSITVLEPVFLYMLSNSKTCLNDGFVFCISNSMSEQIFVTFVALPLENFILPSISTGKFGLTIRAIKL